MEGDLPHPISKPPLLEGYKIAITAERKRNEIAKLLQAYGAEVYLVPAIETIPLIHDGELLQDTKFCLSTKIDFAIISTGVGFKNWIITTKQWGLKDFLIEKLSKAKVVPRGSKARSALRSFGINEFWMPESESFEEILEYFLHLDLENKTILVQLHGSQEYDFIKALEKKGAHVISVRIYQWTLPQDLKELKNLVQNVVDKKLDSVVFTSAPAVSNFLKVADMDNKKSLVLESFKSFVVPSCIGTVTSSPLVIEGITPMLPTKPRLGIFIRDIAYNLSSFQAKRSAIVDDTPLKTVL